MHYQKSAPASLHTCYNMGTSTILQWKTGNSKELPNALWQHRCYTFRGDVKQVIVLGLLEGEQKHTEKWWCSWFIFKNNIEENMVSLCFQKFTWPFNCWHLDELWLIGSLEVKTFRATFLSKAIYILEWSVQYSSALFPSFLTQLFHLSSANATKPRPCTGRAPHFRFQHSALE